MEADLNSATACEDTCSALLYRRSWRYESGIMAKYFARKCPKCRDDFWIVISQPNSNGERPISAYCAVCGYSFDGWRLILGGKRELVTHSTERFRRAVAENEFVTDCS
jgi:hypothetical protein